MCHIILKARNTKQLNKRAYMRKFLTPCCRLLIRLTVFETVHYLVRILNLQQRYHIWSFLTKLISSVLECCKFLWDKIYNYVGFKEKLLVIGNWNYLLILCIWLLLKCMPLNRGPCFKTKKYLLTFWE